MKNKLLTSILAASLALAGCAASPMIQKSKIPNPQIPNGYELIPTFEPDKSLNSVDIVARVYASADKINELPFSDHKAEYQQTCIFNAKMKAYDEIIKQFNPKLLEGRRLDSVDDLTKESIIKNLIMASDPSGKNCYYKGALSEHSLIMMYGDPRRR